MSVDNQHSGTGLHPLHLGLFLAGGASLGTGILFLFWSFGWETGQPLNSDFAQIGFNGLDNISLLQGGEIAVAMVVVGLVCLIFGNATAWKETGGY